MGVTSRKHRWPGVKQRRSFASNTCANGTHGRNAHFIRLICQIKNIDSQAATAESPEPATGAQKVLVSSLGHSAASDETLGTFARDFFSIFSEIRGKKIPVCFKKSRETILPERDCLLHCRIPTTRIE